MATPADTTSTTPLEDRTYSIYTKRYLEAVALFRKQEFQKCLALARHNLTDPTLPHYHLMSNLILLCGAEDRWYPAERYLREAEQIWTNAQQTTPAEEAVSHAALQKLRSNLNHSASCQSEAAPNPIDEIRATPGYQSEEDDDDDDDGELQAWRLEQGVRVALAVMDEDEEKEMEEAGETESGDPQTAEVSVA